ncbi:LysR substrate-binding domain-containing protein [Xylophilus sp. GOD-11R]|uniref:LysR substrate-binding domain-containing protein n=1 Tax=Xylophilus sp. GOD-11R TaxID=3089814 RepID=UPI00298BD089|nr:LysR substrate-binding domain-containing protein [Xylophilus sp. GOD-11R]WPB59391.1 LysR substrate-binding domain-containing protein [Xylophilus sp. GOD-11R]
MVNKSHVMPDDDIVNARTRLPPLNALRSFEAVARQGSFAAAAADLNVTHWAVGKQIRLLEDWFGLALFERRPRGVKLTDEGAALLGDVGVAFERLSSGADRLRGGRPSRQVSGAVRVNVLVSFALHWLLPRLPDFHALYPGIEVRISTTSRKLRYIGDAFDIGVRSGPEEGAGLVSHPLMADERLPACSPALLRQHPIRTAADLEKHTLLHSASTRGAWAQWLAQAGAPRLRAARHVEFEHVFLQQAAALEGLGVTLASLPLIERELAAGRLVCPLSAPVWSAPAYTLVLNAERGKDPAVETFREWMIRGGLSSKR